MNRNQPNWNEIKQTLKENFETDFQIYATTAFSGVDFDKALEIFRYILEQKLLNHDETTAVFDKLQLYAKQQSKDILKGLVASYEPFLKKLFQIKSTPFPAGKTLRWGYDTFFDYLSISQSNKDNFFAQSVISGVKTAQNLSTNFASLLPDNTSFGISLHSAFHLRNSDLHNDPSLTIRQLSDYITHLLNSYLYFTFKYYNELIAVIPSADLLRGDTVTIKDLASLSGGAYNPNIENEVKRESIIQTIEKTIKDLDVLFIEGEDGIGKTTILHQFVAKHPNHCFAYFIDSKDNNTYSNLAILKALCNQLHFITKGYELEEVASVDSLNDDNWLKNYLSSNLHSLSKKPNETFYFIIDGLDEISQDIQNDIKEQILNKIPYNKSNVKLALTGKQNKNLLKNNCQCDKFGMIVLSKEKSKNIFGNSITPEQFDDINSVCQNNAGKIVFFRNLIKTSGFPIDSIIENLSSDMKALYQYLWNNGFNVGS